MPMSRRGEAGSILLLQVFLVVVIVLGITVVADVGSVIGVRRELAATADQAAIAGAQAVDLDAYYRGGAPSAGLALDPQAVAAVVRRYLAPALASGQRDGLRLEEVVVSGDTVTVRLGCQARLPFTASLGLASVPVTASASARLLIQP